jgi:acyl carrier protein
VFWEWSFAEGHRNQERVETEMSEMETKVFKLIAEQLEVPIDQVTAKARFIEDLGADSLDVVELVMTLEEEFEVDIPDEDAQELATVGDAIKYIEEHATE